MGNSPPLKKDKSIFRSSELEVASSSLFNDDDDDGEEEVEHQETKERPNRWLLGSSVEDENILTREIKSASSGEEIWHNLLHNQEIISTIVVMYCSDLLDDLLTLRLVNRSFMKIIEKLNFISFHVLENSRTIEYVVDDEDVKQNQLACKRMRIVRKILENMSNKKEEIPQFLLNNINNKELIFTYNLKERENLTKLSNPFLEILKCSKTKNDQSFQIPSIEIYLEMNHSSIPLHFNMLIVSQETSSFEEYLFRYSFSISDDGVWETKIFPIHKRQFFSSPKNNSHQIQPIIHSNNNLRNTKGGKYQITYSFSSNLELQIATIDIQNNYYRTIDIVPLLSEEYQKRQLGSIQSLVREVKISCSSSDLINICKRVSLKSSFDIS